MGYVKECLITGFSPFNEKHVCKDCFEDYAIREFIKDRAIREECSYCDNKSVHEPIAADMDEVIEFILEGIKSEWDDPVNGVGWCSREGGWLLIDPIDTYDLFGEIGLEIWQEKLLEDIVNSIKACLNNSYYI